MIIWVNGTFGAGKTTTATQLVELSTDLRLFDPEWVGYLLSNNLADHEFTDFQQLPPWRALVPPVADEIARFTGQHLVAVQTVLVEDYWQEIETGLIGLAAADLVINTSETDAESTAAEILQHSRQAKKSISKVG